MTFIVFIRAYEFYVNTAQRFPSSDYLHVINISQTSSNELILLFIMNTLIAYTAASDLLCYNNWNINFSQNGNCRIHRLFFSAEG